jgi:hypothetical protein
MFKEVPPQLLLNALVYQNMDYRQSAAWQIIKSYMGPEQLVKNFRPALGKLIAFIFSNMDCSNLQLFKDFLNVQHEGMASLAAMLCEVNFSNMVNIYLSYLA